MLSSVFSNFPGGNSRVWLGSCQLVLGEVHVLRSTSHYHPTATRTFLEPWPCPVTVWAGAGVRMSGS